MSGSAGSHPSGDASGDLTHESGIVPLALMATSGRSMVTVISSLEPMIPPVLHVVYWCLVIDGNVEATYNSTVSNAPNSSAT